MMIIDFKHAEFDPPVVVQVALGNTDLKKELEEVCFPSRNFWTCSVYSIY